MLWTGDPSGAMRWIRGSCCGGRYRPPQHDPLIHRMAPDGSPVHSISWSREGERYFERLNGRFNTEISQTQYHAAMARQQRAVVGALVFFASLACCVSGAMLILERRVGRGG